MITLIRPAVVQSYTSVIVADPITGDKNGSNKIFNTTYDYKPGRIHFMYNGQTLHSTIDFVESGANEVTLLYIAPYAEDVISATYELRDATLNPSSMLSGTTSLSIGDETKYVSFSRTLANTNYKLNVDLVSESSDPSIYSFVISDKSTTGFRIYFSGEIDAADYILEWSVT